MTTTGGFEPFGYVIIFKEMGDRNTWRLEKNQHRHSNVILVITTAKSFFDCFHGSAAAAAAIRLAVPKDPKKSRKCGKKMITSRSLIRFIRMAVQIRFPGPFSFVSYLF